MTTTTSAAAVTSRRATPEQVAAQLTDEMLSVRVRHLNGRVPKDGAVHQLRRSLKIVRVKAIEFILRIAFSDIDDGAPPAAVSAWMLSAMAIYEQRAQERAAARAEPVVGPHPSALIERENRAQYEGDILERAINANPDSVDLIDRRIAQSAVYRDADDRLLVDLRARKARALANGSTLRLL